MSVQRVKRTDPHPMAHLPLTWSATYLPDVAYGYYGKGATKDYMYCKVTQVRTHWYFRRAGYPCNGYRMPVWMEGVTTVQEAKDVAQVYYFLDGAEVVDLVYENNNAGET
jgi:hypothetical protein